MEGDFKKLINLSQAIDSKLTDVTSSHDVVTAVQAQLRQLEELEKEVAVKYERLESKGNILEVTAGPEWIRTSSPCGSSTVAVKELGAELNDPARRDRLEGVKKSIRALSADKERAEETIDKLSRSRHHCSEGA